MVEIQQCWFCEAVWDGNYESGNLDETDLVFGSGGRIRDGRLTFVSSGTTVDRLQTVALKDAQWVSNSLVCLLAVLHAEVDPGYGGYRDDFETIVSGIRNYKRTIVTSAGPVHLVYFHNLRWDGANLIELEKPYRVRDLNSFAKYRAFLECCIDEIVCNMSAGGRQFPFKMIGTLSSGYDSATAVALARKSGLQEVISCLHARTGQADSGETLGHRLGVRVHLVSHSVWRNEMFAEVPFLASDALGEDVYVCGANDLLRGRVLLTGFGGSMVWDKHAKALGPDIVRSDQSGLSLTEYRLWMGFLHLPLPFVGVRQIQDIHAISHDPEMAPWDIGGEYNRPICRRIIEEAGVPRGSFAVSKKAACVLFFNPTTFLSPASFLDYQSWLSRHSNVWRDRKQIPPHLVAKAWRLLPHVIKAIAFGFRLIARLIPSEHIRSLANRIDGKVSQLEREEYLFLFVFPWALAKAKQRYSHL